MSSRAPIGVVAVVVAAAAACGDSPHYLEIDAGTDGGVIDAAVDAFADPSTRLFIASSEDDSLYVLQADDLTSMPTITLPDRVGAGSNGIEVTSNFVWVSSIQQFTALGRSDLSLVEGYPRTVTGDCFAYSGAFTASAAYCVYAAELTGVGTSRALGYEIAPSGAMSVDFVNAVDLPLPSSIAVTQSRVYVVHGAASRSIGAFDLDLNAVAGSPTAASTGSVVTMIEADDTLGRVVVGADEEVESFDRATLASLGRRTLAANVSGLAFDTARNRLLVGMQDGYVVALRMEDLGDVSPRVQRSATAIVDMTYDRTRDRVYAVAGSTLLVLDGSTLQHVSGSPVSLPTALAGVEFIVD